MSVWIPARDGLFITQRPADPGGPTLRAGCQVVVDPSSEPRECVRIYDDLPARVGVRGGTDAHAFVQSRVQLFYCVCVRAL